MRLRDEHMFKTLENLLAYRGKSSKAVIWAHNSHLGDARATEMSARGELNLGELCRKHFGDAVYSVGFGTDSGTVAAASDWDGPMEVKDVRPAIEGSYEKLFHQTGHAGFFFEARLPAPTCPKPRLNAPSALSIALKPNARATISRPIWRASSTNTSGSTKRGPWRPWGHKNWLVFRRHIHLGSD